MYIVKQHFNSYFEFSLLTFLLIVFNAVIYSGYFFFTRLKDFFLVIEFFRFVVLIMTCYYSFGDLMNYTVQMFTFFFINIIPLYQIKNTLYPISKIKKSKN